jgi:hypothetical protein
MDILAPFRSPGLFDRRRTPRQVERSEDSVDEREQPRFVGWIPLLVPLAAFVLATLVYLIFWASWPY